MLETPKFLKTPRGDVIRYTAIQAAKGLRPCDAKGNILGAAEATDQVDLNAKTDRVETPWLGNPDSGELVPYTPIQAAKPNMISVNTPEEWQAYMARREAEKAAVAPTPAPEQAEKPATILTRQASEKPVGSISVTMTSENGGMHASATEGDADDTLPPETEPPEIIETVSAADVPLIPDITRLEVKDAKDTLYNWAEKVAKVALDRRKGLNTLRGECEVIYNQLTGEDAA